MVNPDDITNYNRNDRELEEFMVFSICAAGKNAHVTARRLNVYFCSAIECKELPIKYLSSYPFLELHLQVSGIGCYNNRAKTIREIAEKIAANKNFLRIATIDDLEEIHGIGPKTSRFFIMHSRPNQRVAALDTHILKELNANGIKAPKSTPPAGKKYRELEQEFIKLADKAGKSVADYDLEIWKKHRKKQFVP